MASSHQPALFAPLVLTRNRETGRAVFSLPAPAAYVLPTGSRADIDRTVITPLPLRPSDTSAARRASFYSEHANRIAAVASMVRAKLQAYQERMHREFNMDVEISWDDMHSIAARMCYACSSHAPPQSTSSFGTNVGVYP
jgi:hypothetical protein